MSRRVHILEDEGLLEIIYTGGVTPEDLAEDRNLGKRVFGEGNVRKVLVDCSEVHLPPSTIPLLEHATGLARSRILARVKHAVVVPEAIVRDARFLETVSRNRGVNMRYFVTRAEALDWLNESPNTAIERRKYSRRKSEQ
jgi:hypothetical protein